MRTIHKRRRDHQRASPAAECFLCGGELYGGEICVRLAGRTLCAECGERPPAFRSWLRAEEVRA